MTTQAAAKPETEQSLAATLKAKIATVIGWLTAAIIVCTQLIEVIELIKIERATSLIDKDTTTLVEKARAQIAAKNLPESAPTPASSAPQ